MALTFSSSYLARDAGACRFFPGDFRDREARVTRTRAAAERSISPALAAVLREQQSLLPPSAARQANLDALCAGNTAVVVSGQQVGLFLGPLYTFYKAASAIAIARALELESGVRTVPLFWLQTEDHDFAEIAGCVVDSDERGPVRLALADEPPQAARCSVAHRRLGPEVGALVEALAGHLGDAPAAAGVVALLRRHYVAGRSLASAFAGALGAVFADEGLLFLDPRDARLAAEAAPIYRRALEDAVPIDRCLAEQAVRLADAGFAEQVPLRPGSPLVFFHRDAPEGPRFRLQRRMDDGAEPAAPASPVTWALAGADDVVSQDRLLARLDREPLSFSTSALLRPLVQDTLLPTAAYVGGPAEISYFAQLVPLYALFDLSPPLIIPRARFRYVDARARRLLEALGISPDDLSRPAPELLERLALARPDGATDPATLKRQIADDIGPRVARLADAVVAARPELARAAERTRHSVSHALRRLTDRYARALLERDGATRERLARLQALLAPGGAPQERVYGWPWLAARVGPDLLKTLVFEALAKDGTYVTRLLELRP